MHITPVISLLLAVAAALPAQASFTPFGTGCAWNNIPLAIGNSGLPHLGQTFAITYSGPNHFMNSAQQIAQPWIALGLQPQTYAIPAGLFLQQPAGCTAYLTPLSMTPMPADPVLPLYVSSFALAIPNDPGLLGVQLLAQWLTVGQQCGFAGCGIAAALTSDAAAIVIGP